MSDTSTITPATSESKSTTETKKRVRRTKAQLIEAGVLNPDGTRKQKEAKNKTVKVTLPEPDGQTLIALESSAEEFKHFSLEEGYARVLAHIRENMDGANKNFFNHDADFKNCTIEESMARNIVSCFGMDQKFVNTMLLKAHKTQPTKPETKNKA